MRVFITAYGESTRWNNYLGVPKHLIPIDDEPLIHRTVRLLKENGFDDIVIIGDDQVDGTRNHIPSQRTLLPYNSMREDVEGIESMIILYGDCYYSEAIIKSLRDCKSNKPLLHWCWHHVNQYTGKPYPEGYAQRITDVPLYIRKMNEYEELVNSGKHKHWLDWEALRYYMGLDITKHQPELMKEYEIEWHDETDDFDFHEDYHRFMKRVKGIDVP